MFTLHKLKDDKELSELIKLQMQEFNGDFIPLDFASSFISFKKSIAFGGYLRVIKDSENNIVGWIAAQQTKMPYSKIPVLNQCHYNCILTGMEAIRCLELSHKGLIDYAEAAKIPIVMSCSSHFDEKNLLARILEKMGWQRKGYAAIWRTSHHNEPSGLHKLKQ